MVYSFHIMKLCSFDLQAIMKRKLEKEVIAWQCYKSKMSYQGSQTHSEYNLKHLNLIWAWQQFEGGTSNNITSKLLFKWSSSLSRSLIAWLYACIGDDWLVVWICNSTIKVITVVKVKTKTVQGYFCFSVHFISHFSWFEVLNTSRK